MCVSEWVSADKEINIRIKMWKEDVEKKTDEREKKSNFIL